MVAYLFCSTTLLLASTRWGRSTFELCTVHPLGSVLAINLTHIKLIFLRKYFRNTENTLGCWVVRSANATSVLCRPHGCITFKGSYKFHGTLGYKQGQLHKTKSYNQSQALCHVYISSGFFYSKLRLSCLVKANLVHFFSRGSICCFISTLLHWAKVLASGRKLLNQYQVLQSPNQWRMTSILVWGPLNWQA